MKGRGMRRTVVVYLAVAMQLPMLAPLAAEYVPAPQSAVEPTRNVLPPCEHEDSENCYWDASTRGNGVGDSFVNIGGVTYYLGVAP